MWRNWLIGTVLCLAFVAYRLSGPPTADAMGQILIAVAIPLVWLIVVAARHFRHRQKTR